MYKKDTTSHCKMTFEKSCALWKVYKYNKRPILISEHYKKNSAFILGRPAFSHSFTKGGN